MYKYSTLFRPYSLPNVRRFLLSSPWARFHEPCGFAHYSPIHRSTERGTPHAIINPELPFVRITPVEFAQVDKRSRYDYISFKSECLYVSSLKLPNWATIVTCHLVLFVLQRKQFMDTTNYVLWTLLTSLLYIRLEFHVYILFIQLAIYFQQNGYKCHRLTIYSKHSKLNL